MAEIIGTKEAVSEMDKLIRDAKENLILITPYLKLSKYFRDRLKIRNDEKKITKIIFREKELKSEEKKFLESLSYVELKYSEDLHAKCYLNDSKMIITSLNFYDFSMTNNKEMGILIDRNNPTDRKLYDDGMREVQFILKTSKDYKLGSSKKSSSPRGKKEKYNDSDTGYCIRTGVEIPFNLDKPFCLEAYRIWSEYEDPDYPENFCHFSGEESDGETSFYRPILKKNWKKAVKVHNLE